MSTGDNPTREDKDLVGHVFQISPEYPHKAFAGCFFVVSEVKPWGLIGYCSNLGKNRDTVGGQAYMRIVDNDVKKHLAYVGLATWVVS